MHIYNDSNNGWECLQIWGHSAQIVVGVGLARVHGSGVVDDIDAVMNGEGEGLREEGAGLWVCDLGGKRMMKNLLCYT